MVATKFESEAAAALTSEAHDGSNIGLVDSGRSLQVNQLRELGDHSHLQQKQLAAHFFVAPTMIAASQRMRPAHAHKDPATDPMVAGTVTISGVCLAGQPVTCAGSCFCNATHSAWRH